MSHLNYYDNNGESKKKINQDGHPIMKSNQ